MVQDWLDRHALTLPDDPWLLQTERSAALGALDARIARARILVLGETNHFIREKVDFRLCWLRWLCEQSQSRDRQIIIGEELGWADGRRVASYLSTGNARQLDQAATFGGKAHQRPDRNDAPRGVFATSLADYPFTLMRRSHGRFYAGLRALGLTEFFGFDVDAPGAGYHALSNAVAVAEEAGLPVDFATGLQRRQGETMTEEAERLQDLVRRFSGEAGYSSVAPDLQAMLDSVRYRLLADQANDYEATRPAMAWREDSMKRRLASVLAGSLGAMSADPLIVLLGHAFHLARHDGGIVGQGVGPGGGGTPSLGHWLHNEQGLAMAAVWMLYGEGRDSQPLQDLPNEAAYPADSVNGVLRSRGEPLVVPLLDADCPWGPGSGIGHLYNLVAAVDLRAEADAIHFIPLVTPLS